MSTRPPEREGDYPDHDLGDGDVQPGEGAYTDQETSAEARGGTPDLGGPDDDGEYTDSDVLEEHRPAPMQGSYVQRDVTTTTEDGREDSEHG